jgi:hypothetical protein
MTVVGFLSLKEEGELENSLIQSKEQELTLLPHCPDPPIHLNKFSYPSKILLSLCPQTFPETLGELLHAQRSPMLHHWHTLLKTGHHYTSRF